MVSKKLDEEDIKAMFSQFGPIEDCTVLRDDNGISRGLFLFAAITGTETGDCVVTCDNPAVGRLNLKRIVFSSFFLASLRFLYES